jgi:hypothetical protein
MSRNGDWSILAVRQPPIHLSIDPVVFAQPRVCARRANKDECPRGLQSGRMHCGPILHGRGGLIEVDRG